MHVQASGCQSCGTHRRSTVSRTMTMRDGPVLTETAQDILILALVAAVFFGFTFGEFTS